jgi:hypothetical protein
VFYEFVPLGVQSSTCMCAPPLFVTRNVLSSNEVKRKSGTSWRDIFPELPQVLPDSSKKQIPLLQNLGIRLVFNYTNHRKRHMYLLKRVY